MNMQDITNKIKSTRAALGISQEELAELSGLSLRSIQRIEGGETTPRGDSLKRIAQALKIDIRELTLPSQEPMPGVAAKPDTGIVILMLLSAYGFMFHPLVGLGLPVLLFVLYRNTNPLVKKFGRKIILLESVNCGLVLFFYGLMAATRFFHFPEIIRFETLMILTLSVYVLHIVLISVLILQFVKSTRAGGINATEALPS
jgi:transcriptional regulator with XRE-family HTH domain